MRQKKPKLFRVVLPKLTIRGRYGGGGEKDRRMEGREEGRELPTADVS